MKKILFNLLPAILLLSALGHAQTYVAPVPAPIVNYNGLAFVNGYSGPTVDPQTGDYTMGCPTDRQGEVEFNISSAHGFYLPQAGSTNCLGSNLAVFVRNTSSSTAVLTVCAGTGTNGSCTPGSSSFQPEAVASYPLLPNSALFIYSDATTSTGNYHLVIVPPTYGGVNKQTGAYTAAAADRNKLIPMDCTSACALTLPATPPSVNWTITVVSWGSTLATVGLNSLNFNGSATAPVLETGVVMHIFTDGSNYFGDSGLGTSNITPTFYGPDSGAVNAAVVTLSPPMSAYVTGVHFCFTPAVNSTSASPTVNVNGLGAKTIVKYNNTTLFSGDLNTLQDACLEYNTSGNFQLMNPASYSGNGAAARATSPTFTTSIIVNGNVQTADGSFGSNQTNTETGCAATFGTTTVNTGSVTTTTSVSCLPANSIIDAVVYRITTSITTAASFTIGQTGSTSQFCSTQSTLTSGTTGICIPSAFAVQASAAAVLATFNAAPGAGAIRLLVYSHTWTAPTS
jgi:hypothetical protein